MLVATLAMLMDVIPNTDYVFDLDHTCPVLLIPDGPVCGPSRCESRPVVAQQEPSICSSSSHPTTGSIAVRDLF